MRAFRFPVCKDDTEGCEQHVSPAGAFVKRPRHALTACAVLLLALPVAAQPPSAADDYDDLSDILGSEQEAASSREEPHLHSDQPESVGTVPIAPLRASGPEEQVQQARPRRSVLVEEIVVTAQKREENIQDVPIAVSAFSGEQLTTLGIESTKDLTRITPGLQFSEIAGFTLVYLRGVGTDSFLPYADPSVATYVDGLYIPAQQGLVNSLGGVERVEVLKGPQGTLFGRNSTGGAINVITKSPGQEHELSLQADVGNLGTRNLQAYVSVPVTEKIGISLSGVYNHTNPYYRIVTEDLGPLELPPEDMLHPEESLGGRIKIRWQPTDDLELGLGTYLLRQTGSGSTIGALKKPSLIATLLGIRAEENDYEIHRNEKTLLTVETSTAYGDAKWMLPWFDLKLIGGYQDTRTKDAYYDFDNSAKDIVSFFTNNAFSRVTTAEFQIASNDGSWRSDRFKWIGGLYYLHSDAGYDPITVEVLGDGLPVIDPLLEALNLPEDLVTQLLNALPLLGSVPGLTVEDGLGVRVDINGVLRTNSYSAFLQGDYNFTDWFGITLGGRYQEEDRFLIDQRASLTSENKENNLPVLTYNRPKVTQYNFSPKVSLNFRFFDDELLYLSWSKGYKSGTYNGINIYTPPSYVEPEEVNSYEVGIKSNLLDGNLRFNAAVFYSDVDQLQVTYVSLVNGGAITFENAGSARIRGAEFDALWVLFPHWNPGFVLTGGVSYLDSIFTDYRNASGFDDTTGLFFSKSGDFTGNRIPRSPEWSGNLGLHQTLDTRWGPVEVGADVYYNGGFFYNAQNTDHARQKEYSLLNARVSYTYEPWNLKLTVFGQNLDDETYSYSQFTADFGTNITLAPPRTYGFRVSWELWN